MIRVWLRRFKRLLRYGKLGVFLRGQGRFTLPSRALEEIFPGCGKCEVLLPAEHLMATSQDSMIVPSGEILALAAMCQQRQFLRIFEIGTYRGTSSLIMAMNTPDQARLWTLDFKPDKMPFAGGRDYIAGDFFLQTRWAEKIRQVYGDSKSFDFSPYYRSMDLVFVDADHTYASVKADSLQAFQLINKRGVIIWDDYRWNADYPECSGVADYLHEQLSQKKIYQVKGTRFAIYKQEGDPC